MTLKIPNKENNEYNNLYVLGANPELFSILTFDNFYNCSDKCDILVELVEVSGMFIDNFFVLIYNFYL